jgi:hypothetical protein
MSTPDVRPGQVWADNDKRAKGRTLRVDRVDYDEQRGYRVASCTVLTMDEASKARQRAGIGRDLVGSRTRVAVKRMRPNSTGYRLLSDVDGPA